MTEGPNVPTYRSKEPVRARVEVAVPSGTEKVIAFFKHADDPYIRAAMVGKVEAGASGFTSVLLEGTALVGENGVYGEYLCESLHAEYADGRRVSFLSVPDVRYRIVRDHDPGSEATHEEQAALVGWSWL